LTAFSPSLWLRLRRGITVCFEVQVHRAGVLSRINAIATMFAIKGCCFIRVGIDEAATHSSDVLGSLAVG